MQDTRGIAKLSRDGAARTRCTPASREARPPQPRAVGSADFAGAQLGTAVALAMWSMTDPLRILILGAAGRGFHDFNVVYRDDPSSRVVAFTATQIPAIAGRRYPPSLAGPLYPSGIPIVDETELKSLCRRERVELVVFAYSDVSHAHVMAVASRALAAGADFALLGPDRTMLQAAVPLIAISAVRTGCGKSPIARWIARRLRDAGHRVTVIRHPMPYRDLERQRVQRFATRADLDAADARSKSARNTSRISRRGT